LGPAGIDQSKMQAGAKTDSRYSRFASLEAVHAKGLFGPAGIDQRKMQAGCQNGQQR